jgi:23S rRNA (adenine1618-N6)-methyltransferase
MTQKKVIHPKEKSGLHSRNKHRERYEFHLLIDSCPDLHHFVKINEYGDESIDFFNPSAVITLNKALLQHFYDIDYWEIPSGYLCPPIPGRAEYIHYMADLPDFSNYGASIRDNKSIRCLDIGAGANCVYPIIGVKEYGWNFVGSDIDPIAIESAKKIVDSNKLLQGKVELRLQINSSDFFKGIIREGEVFDLSVCNPPFHSSAEEARKGTLRKLSNLKQKKITKAVQNFGGQSNELWCEGGEAKFIADLIWQSRQFSQSCKWFSSLISRQMHLDNAIKLLEKVEATEIKVVSLNHGNKISSIVAWSFFDQTRK